MSTPSEEEEMLAAYQLKTLDPESWDDSIENAAVTAFTHHDVDEVEDKAYDVLLELVNRDFAQGSNSVLVDPLNPSRSINDKLLQSSILTANISEFNIASKQFTSKQFLKVIHARDSFDELRQGLNSLEDSITHKNKELRQLVEREALKFVKSKSSLDHVLQQFQKSGFNDGNGGLGAFKTSVSDANKEGTLLVKPILANKQKELKLKQSIELIEQKKLFFNLPKQLRRYIQDHDYDNFIHYYKQAKVMKESDNSKVVNRIWEEVDEITDSYKRRLWSSLNKNDKSDDFLKSIKKLMELDAIDNPILEWINVRCKTFIVDFIETFERYREKILNLQVNILSTLSYPDFSHFKAALSGNDQLVDSTIIIEMWLMFRKMEDVLRAQSQEFIRFWNHVENFINGNYLQKLQSNYIDPNSPFLRLEDYEIAEVRARGENCIDKFVNKVSLFFNSTQNSLDPDTPESKSDGSLSNFGFIPPFTNSLSTLKYLPYILGAVSETLNDLGQLSISNKVVESLRSLSLTINERVIGGVCASWLSDCHNFYRLEDWTKLDSGETTLPGSILEFETSVIEKLGDLLFARLPEGKEVQIVKYPSKKILTGIEIQFLRSFDILLESMIKKVIEENHDPSISRYAKNHHKLLTLFNIKKMAQNVVPSLLEKYDAVFETQLQSRKLEIYNILQKMEYTIFDAYMTEQRKPISKIVHHGVSSLDWSSINSKPTKVSSYIYETVNVLVNVHIGVLSVSPELIGNVMRDLVEYVSTCLLKEFRDISLFSMEAISRVILDVEFFKAVVGRSATSTTLNNLKLIYKTISTGNVNLGSMLDLNAEILADAMAGSRIECDIFNS
jgi:exocyst complex component 2